MAKRYVKVTSTNIKSVAEDLMMSPTELSIQYMQAKLKGMHLIFEVHESDKKSDSFANRFNEDISKE